MKKRALTRSFQIIVCLLLSLTAFAQAPAITSFTPSSGPVGTLVTITGTNLGTPTAFTIGGLTAIVISNTGTTLVGMVMPGATTGAISVTTAGGTVNATGNFTVTATPYPSTQQGNKLVGTGITGAAQQGYSVSVSADGNTAIVGGRLDNNYQGAAWIYTRTAGVWTQQGTKLVGTGNTGDAQQGISVSISADGNTAIVGGNRDNGFQGAAWVYTRTAGVWTQQGAKLVGTGNTGFAQQGWSVSVSADGNTAIVGGNADNANQGAAWVYTRTAGVWSQQGNKLVGTGSTGAAQQGISVSVSADGNTAIVGGNADNANQGAAWIYTRTAGVWSQQGNKLVGTGNTGAAQQGTSVSVSADGNTAIVGGFRDNNYQGAAWVYIRTAGVWSQQGAKLVGTGNTGVATQGQSVSLSADGNTAIVGGNNDNGIQGAAWIYTRTAGVWSQQGNKIVGTGSIGAASQGVSVSLSADGNTAIVGGFFDNNLEGAVWAFTYVPPPPPTISSFTASSGPVGSLVSITGTNLTGSTALTIGGVSAIAISNTGTSLVAMVMPGATTGAISITTAGGTVNATGNFTVTVSQAPNGQQGNKLVGTGNTGAAQQGYSVSVSADGNTAIVGGRTDNNFQGAAWVYTRSGGVWSQQGNKLVGTGSIGIPQQGWSVSVSADGNTAIVGGLSDNSGQGAAWVYTRTVGVWSQQGTKLVGTGNTGTANQGTSVSLSADGNTAIVGGYLDNGDQGAAWVYTRTAGVWSQQGNKLVGTGNNTGAALQGQSVSVSADGNTAIVGGDHDNNNQGAAWVYTRSGGTWTQQGNKLVGTGNTGAARQGQSVSVSADGNTAIVGGNADNANRGAAWVYTRTAGVWSQQGNKLVGTGNTGDAEQGFSVSVSADGNTAIVGGTLDNSGQGAAWVYTRTAGVWSQQGNKLVGTGNTGVAQQGYSVSLSADGTTTMVGGRADNSNQGAVWAFGYVPSTDADLSTLTTTAGVLSPVFASGTLAYTASVPNATTSITLTPTRAEGTATIKVNTVTVASGSASTALPLVVGSNTITTVVTAGDGTTTKTYTLTVTRVSTNADLSILTTTAGALSPVFASGTTDYSLSVPATTSSTTVTPTVDQANATVTVNGTAVASGAASGSIALVTGINVITTIVTAQDGTTIKTYTITVNRAVPLFPYSESFRNTSVSGMIYGGTPNLATLTATSIDVDGTGYLRLTNSGANQSGFARNSKAFPTANGLSVSFEYYTYGGSGGDGLSFFLYDASANSSFQIGAPAGSLGYAQSTNSGGLPGVSKAYLGLGLDEFGNFSNPTAGRQGGPGARASGISLRGDGNGVAAVATNYEYLTGIQTSNAAAMSAAGAGSAFLMAGMVNGRTGNITGRPQGGLLPTESGYRKAKIELTLNGLGTGFILNVWITEGNAGISTIHQVVTNYSYIGSNVPEFLSYGFTASTGGSNNFHEVRNLAITLPQAGSMAPFVADINKSGSVNTVIPFSALNFSEKFSSPDGNPIQKVKVTSLPSNGTLKFNGVDITLNQEININDIAQFNYTPAANFTGAVSFGWNGTNTAVYATNNAIVSVNIAPTGTLTLPYSESFRNSTASNMVYGGTSLAVLTASAGTDTEGAGYLRLTSNAANQNGFARNTSSLPTADGLNISFDYYTYGGTGADGFTFFLYDATANSAFQIGAPGGSLGYAQNSTLPGVSKGYLGFGFDEFGNFSTATAGRQGGPGQKASSLTIRGDGNGVGAGSPAGSNYEFLTNIQTSNAAQMTSLNAGTAFFIGGNVNGRTIGAVGLGVNNAGYRKVQIELKPNGLGTGFLINVWITEGNLSGGIVHQVVKDFAYAGTSVPANLSYGFAGSTGGSTNFHEIRNLDIRVPGAFTIPSMMAIKETTFEGFVNRFSNIQSQRDESKELSATNLISPNGDGKNDTWVIRNIEKYPNNFVRVFDRLGRMVYSEANYTNSWDGIYQGAILPEDTYYYIINLPDGEGQKRGYVSIIR